MHLRTHTHRAAKRGSVRNTLLVKIISRLLRQWTVTTACTLVQRCGLHCSTLPLHSCCGVSPIGFVTHLKARGMYTNSVGSPYNQVSSTVEHIVTTSPRIDLRGIQFIVIKISGHIRSVSISIFAFGRW
uniref:Uncharacterized protein n=1 Tax=Trypanosoma congolense (strain IL3000) TaxID=1068625 RepID=G0UQY5_TRYCI|nr:hypothetical protein, unlikely [Trypanosoma congolense IL3000]